MFPKLTKYKKSFKGHIKGFDSSKNACRLQFGIAGLQVLENGRLTAKHLEAIRRVIIRKTNREGKILFGVFPNIPISKKPQEIRMGKGKGAVTYWAANVKKYRVIIELIGIDLGVAKQALIIASKKIPLKTKLIFK